MLKKNINSNTKEEESEKNKKLTTTEAVIIKFRNQKLPGKITIYNTERKINILKPRIKFKWDYLICKQLKSESNKIINFLTFFFLFVCAYDLGYLQSRI